MSLYNRRGVSAQKEDVHAATRALDKGIYPKAFCKIYPDFLGKDDGWVNVMHADGAGTKSILAYLYWKETGDISVWRGIAVDAIIMNLDDLLCTGIYDNLLFSSTIDRNKHRIPGEVLNELIDSSKEFFDTMRAFDVNIHYLGGETADVGDVVRTIAVNGTMTARWPKSKLITNEKISAGDVIVGLAGFGKATYEVEYNSGIGSNGLTSARHDTLEKGYAHYRETYDDQLEHDVVYIGKHRMTDEIETLEGTRMHVGKLLLSPTRTFAPLIKNILEDYFDGIHGMIHCSGGGQTKCLHYVPEKVRVINDNLFSPPEIFRIIQEASGADAKEMYQVFNMGCRMELYVDQRIAASIITVAKKFNIQAAIIGRVEACDRKELLITVDGQQLVF